jgi:NAD(P)-dependent dehydrogenase (short-subunit alcohol dehydrogenase family)
LHCISIALASGNRTVNANPCYVVLGSTGGIGDALCARLRSINCNVLASGRDPDKLREQAALRGVRPFTADATDPEQVSACLADAQQAFGRIDGITNCVGSLLLKPAHLTTASEWQAAITTNLTSAFATVHAGAKALMATGGSIVLVSSVAARVGLANHEAIAAAKAGVIGLALAAAATYADRRIRINCVAPGMIRTPLTAKLTANETSLKASTAMHPLGRIGEPEEVAAAIAWLLDGEQSWVTGQVLGVDGGLSTLRSRPRS